jgi:hypothetical protein
MLYINRLTLALVGSGKHMKQKKERLLSLKLNTNKTNMNDLIKTL